MPRGRPPLDPDIKQQRREETLKRYKEKGRSLTKAFIQYLTSRPPRHRAAVMASDIFTQRKYARKAALASERYRDRKLEEVRAERCTTDTIVKQARRLERDALRTKHSKPSKIKRLPPPPPPPPPLAKLPPHAVSKRRALSPITPTPVSRRAPSILSAAVVHDELSGDELDEEREHRPPAELPIWPGRGPRPQRCSHCYQEDCVGCACLCPDSNEWFEHPGGHYFPTSAALNLILLDIMADSYPGILLCEPKYAPDPGHEDRYEHPGPFYAVVCKEWRGVVTSKASRKRMMEQYPHAYTWEASPWWTFDRRWTLDCTEYHEHEGEHPVADEPIRPVTPDSGQRQPPPSTDSGSSPRRPGSASISPPRLTATEDANGWAREVEHGPVHMIAEQGAREAEEGEESQGENLGPRQRKEVEVFVGERAQENRAQGPATVMYAVSGKQRIFRNRDRAVAVLKRSPGAELLFSNNENKLFDFLAEDLEGKLQI
ncbi:hypothetical protein B0H14DRAFT_2624291 [Mycena olivaceomarginata]|nr:hypothetical protein B0H14DRAFT_2624291 [Mycena olivaceomarginata]